MYDPQSSGLMLGTATGGRFSGSDNMAKVHRAQWDDYKARFAPVENLLFSRFNDSTNTDKAVASAANTMNQAFDNSLAQTNRGLSRYGIAPTGAQAVQRERTHGLKQAASVAGAKNAMRTAKSDQKMGLMNGGLSAVAQSRSN
ncbi:hypothetical protein [Marinobacter sp.]|uniref:hypothetical protein n=1 Tax=Marinobacter sp. TaxID=50741 RepID=UPI003A947B7B